MTSNALRRGLPGTGHIHAMDAVFGNPNPDFFRCLLFRLFLGKIKNQQGASMLVGQSYGQVGSSGQGAPAKNQGSIGFDHVFLGADRIPGFGCFLQLVVGLNRSVLGTPSPGAPAAMVDLKKDGGVQGGPVHSGLTTRDDSQKR